jgi:hypothetical protein
MTARWTIHLRQTPRGWQWSKDGAAAWWGFYATAGRAKGAAKRSVPKAIGKSNPADFAFIIVE